MMTEMVIKTSVQYVHLTRLMAREDPDDNDRDGHRNVGTIRTTNAADSPR
jgi:hypothetical protein